MNNKAVIPIIVGIILLFIIIGSVFAVGSSIPSGNYKVIITGKVSYNSIFGSWDVTGDLKEQLPDTYFSIMGIFPDLRWPWETGQVIVKCKMVNKDTSAEYTDDSNAGRVSSWFGGSTGYRLEVRNVPEGEYYTSIKVYENEYFRVSKNIGLWEIGT